MVVGIVWSWWRLVVSFFNLSYEVPVVLWWRSSRVVIGRWRRTIVGIAIAVILRRWRAFGIIVWRRGGSPDRKFLVVRSWHRSGDDEAAANEQEERG
jgi:hypothetical protein